MRQCDGNPAVWHDPNVDNCSTVEITRITAEVDYLIAIFAASQDPKNSDRKVVIEHDVLQSITSELLSATNKRDGSILLNDLINIIDTVGDLLRLFYIPTKNTSGEKSSSQDLTKARKKIWEIELDIQALLLLMKLKFLTMIKSS